MSFPKTSFHFLYDFSFWCSKIPYFSVERGKEKESEAKSNYLLIFIFDYDVLL